jgi:hypothetical protein
MHAKILEYPKIIVPLQPINQHYKQQQYNYGRLPGGNLQTVRRGMASKAANPFAAND